jgi:hypothetical protein
MYILLVGLSVRYATGFRATSTASVTLIRNKVVAHKNAMQLST